MVDAQGCNMENYDKYDETEYEKLKRYPDLYENEDPDFRYSYECLKKHENLADDKTKHFPQLNCYPKFSEENEKDFSANTHDVVQSVVDFEISEEKDKDANIVEYDSGYTSNLPYEISDSPTVLTNGITREENNFKPDGEATHSRQISSGHMQENDSRDYVQKKNETKKGKFRFIYKKKCLRRLTGLRNYRKCVVFKKRSKARKRNPSVNWGKKWKAMMNRYKNRKPSKLERKKDLMDLTCSRKTVFKILHSFKYHTSKKIRTKQVRLNWAKQVCVFLASAKKYLKVMKKKLKLLSRKYTRKNIKNKFYKFLNWLPSTVEYGRNFFVCPVTVTFSNHFNEWNRLASFSSFPESKTYAIVLARDGFYFTGKGYKCRCFSCGVAIYLNPHLHLSERDLRSYHRTCKLIHNVPIPRDGGSLYGFKLPSENKREYKDALGRSVCLKNMCGLNCFFVDQIIILTKFPYLQDLYKAYPHFSFKKIINFLNICVQETSSVGMVDILRYVSFIKEDQVCINMSNFFINNFICKLFEGAVVVKGRCGCREIQQTGDQIVVQCELCKTKIKWELIEKPPCLFFNLHFTKRKLESINRLPEVLLIQGDRYGRGSVYYHGSNHFTLVVNQNRVQKYYDDRNVGHSDEFAADLVDFTGDTRGRELCLVSYYRIT